MKLCVLLCNRQKRELEMRASLPVVTPPPTAAAMTAGSDVSVNTRLQVSITYTHAQLLKS